MIRFTWLQFRTQALVVLGVLAVIAVVLVVTGIPLAHAYDTTVATCGPRHDCASVLSTFPLHRDGTLRGVLSALVIAVPGLIGMFWGAPLAGRGSPELPLISAGLTAVEHVASRRGCGYGAHGHPRSTIANQLAVIVEAPELWLDPQHVVDVIHAHPRHRQLPVVAGDHELWLGLEPGWDGRPDVTGRDQLAALSVPRREHKVYPPGRRELL